MNGIRNTYLYVCGSQRLLDIRRIYTSAGLIGLKLHDNDYLFLVPPTPVHIFGLSTFRCPSNSFVVFDRV